MSLNFRLYKNVCGQNRSLVFKEQIILMIMYFRTQTILRLRPKLNQFRIWKNLRKISRCVPQTRYLNN